MSRDAASRRSSAWLPWAVAILLAGGAAAWNASAHGGEVMGPVSDESLLVPLALRQAGLASYAGDRWIEATSGVFSVAYSWIVGTMLRSIDDPVVALRWLALPFHAVFLAGSWRFTERIAGRAASALATGLLVLAPFGPACLAAGGALPRDLVFALVPWFLVALDDLDNRTSWLAPVLFLLLGIVANLHPLTALHLAGLMLLAGLVLDRTARASRSALVRGAAFLLGASPYVVQYLARSAAPGALDETVYAWRLGAMAGETIGPWTLRMETLLWTSAAAAVLLFVSRKDGLRLPRWGVRCAAVALLLAALGPTLGRFVAPLRAFQFGRYERFAEWFAAVLVATGAVAAIRTRRFVALAAAALLLAVAIWGPGLAGGVAGRGPIARLGRSIDRRAGVPFEPPRPAGLASRAAPDPTSPANREAFLAVCRFARQSTPEDALFVVPPEHWAPFRAYACRGALVTRKEGGAALSFLGARGMDWFRDYAGAVGVFAGGGEEDWMSLAGTGAAYAIDDGAAAAPAWTVAFAAGKFRVLAAPRK